VKNIIYYHIFLINNWKEIVNEQIERLKKSNLFYNSLIKIGAVHDERDFSQNEILKSIFYKYENVEILFIKPNRCFGESETLAELKDSCDSLDKNLNIFYIHAKGVTQYQTEKEIHVANWRKMMEYFLIDRWEKCINILDDGYDCCGVNYQPHSGNISGNIKLIMIFNGNFFWVKSDYIKKLDKNLLFEHRYSAENWICSNDHKGYSFYNTPITTNLYYQTNENYKNE
jgi:hypothetical protein